jgi:CheY-like chemotaxis protein
MITCQQPLTSPACSLHVLVAEDNPDGRATLCTLLKLLGHEVDTAEDGVRAIEQALAYHPDVVFIDIGLPRLDGYQVAQQVRAALGPAVLLIAYTAYSQPEDRQRAFTSGIDAYLVKPVSLAELGDWLAVAARRQRHIHS